jgi:hypothetical protein
VRYRYGFRRDHEGRESRLLLIERCDGSYRKRKKEVERGGHLILTALNCSRSRAFARALGLKREELEIVDREAPAPTLDGVSRPKPLLGVLESYDIF